MQTHAPKMLDGSIEVPKNPPLSHLPLLSAPTQIGKGRAAWGHRERMNRGPCLTIKRRLEALNFLWGAGLPTMYGIQKKSAARPLLQTFSKISEPHLVFQSLRATSSAWHSWAHATAKQTGNWIRRKLDANFYDNVFARSLFACHGPFMETCFCCKITLHYMLTYAHQALRRQAEYAWIRLFRHKQTTIRRRRTCI